VLILVAIEPVSQWTIEQVGQWIETLSREKGIGNSDALKQRFIENEIDGATLLKLNMSHLEKLGITKIKDITLVEEAISNLKQGNSHIQIHNFVETTKREREVEAESPKKTIKSTNKVGIDAFICFHYIYLLYLLYLFPLS
jgi:S-adenosylmethionine/arginine decarboxylase-like enzyme